MSESLPTCLWFGGYRFVKLRADWLFSKIFWVWQATRKAIWLWLCSAAFRPMILILTISLHGDTGSQSLYLITVFVCLYETLQGPSPASAKPKVISPSSQQHGSRRPHHTYCSLSHHLHMCACDFQHLQKTTSAWRQGLSYTLNQHCLLILW